MSYFDWDPRSEWGAFIAFASIVALGLALILLGAFVG